MGKDHQIQVFSTAPQPCTVKPGAYLRHVADVARWSENAGCRGILVYTDHSQLDPWLVSQVIIENTRSLSPLVAVQPVYMHPYTVAKLVATLGCLYNRRVYLNMVAGGFKNDLASLDDNTPHDKRYARVTEYTRIIQELLMGPGAVSMSGEFYTVTNLRMTPPFDPGLCPGVFISGSSEAGTAAARELGATAIQYPKPVDECLAQPRQEGLDAGIRVGVIARSTNAAAWRVAHERFPEDRKGQIAHRLAMKVSDSSWHHELSEMASQTREKPSPYWLVPFENYKTFCPYLVGSYEQVAQEIVRYVDAGFYTFILDIPADEEELHHVGTTFELALNKRNIAL